MKYTLRIKKNRTFKKILKIGKYSSNKHLSIHCLKNRNNKSFFGVCVSKKNGISVHRNKLKRWAREVYKLQEELLKKGFYIVVIYKKTTTLNDVNYNVIYKEMLECLKDLNLYE